jgi:ferrous iron transport protein B
MTVLEAELGCRLPALDQADQITTRTATSIEGPPVVAIVGRPNVGKSTFYGKASGAFVETANLPGTTVSMARREVELDGRSAVLVDLPGAFGLTDQSDGLPSFWRLLLAARPDAILAIVDAGDLSRHLPLVLACRDLGLPMVVAANLADEAQARGIDPDLGRLSQLLAVPVYRAVGRTGEGVHRAVGAAIGLATDRRRHGRSTHRTSPVPPYAARAVRAVQALAHAIDTAGPAADAVPDDLRAEVAAGRLSAIGAATLIMGGDLESQRWAVAEGWAAQVDHRFDVAPRMLDRVGRLITAPWPGIPIFAAVTVLSLLTTMIVGTALATAMSEVWGAVVSPVMTGVVTSAIPIPALSAASLWALDSGLLAMLTVGIPFVLCFYLILAALEDSGYLAAAAVLSDRIFNALGLSGRASIPVLAATGCNVPAIYATRVLDTRRERLLASFLIILTPCSARSAVVCAALVPIAGIGAALAAFGVVALVAIGAGVAANALVPGRQSPLVLEIPSLRLPIARQVGLKAWFRFRSFIRMAAPVMLVGSFLLGLAYETGAIRPLESALSPVTSGVLGLPPVAGIALVLAFLRKELALQLLVVLAIAEYGASASNLSTFMDPGQVFVYAVVVAISIPCIATLASLIDEFGRPTALVLNGAVIGLALATGAVVARLVGVA